MAKYSINKTHAYELHASHHRGSNPIRAEHDLVRSLPVRLKSVVDCFLDTPVSLNTLELAILIEVSVHLSNALYYFYWNHSKVYLNRGGNYGAQIIFEKKYIENRTQ